jgi:hypothetical protein
VSTLTQIMGRFTKTVAVTPTPLRRGFHIDPRLPLIDHDLLVRSSRESSSLCLGRAVSLLADLGNKELAEGTNRGGILK